MLTDDELQLIRLFRNLSPEEKIKLLEAASIEEAPPYTGDPACLAEISVGTEVTA